MVTLSKMLIAFWVSTIYHFECFYTTVKAGRHYGRIDSVYIHRHPVIKYITLSFKVFPSYFLAVFDYSSMQLINILKTMMQQKSGRLFALYPTCTIGKNLFAFILC